MKPSHLIRNTMLILMLGNAIFFAHQITKNKYINKEKTISIEKGAFANEDSIYKIVTYSKSHAIIRVNQNTDKTPEVINNLTISKKGIYIQKEKKITTAKISSGIGTFMFLIMAYSFIIMLKKDKDKFNNKKNKK